MPGKDFSRTGNKGKGDIWIINPNGTPLVVEAKSYAARERFVRALHDIKASEKVGVGFFREPKEFNQSSSKVYISAKAWAIYLPDDILKSLDPKSLKLLAITQDLLYRPLSNFFGDAVFYNKNGKLPAYL